MDDQEIRNRLVQKMLRKRITGAKNRTISFVVNNSGLAVHEQGRARELLSEMVSDPNAPIEAYGGQRGAVRLTNPEAAKQYLRDNGGDVPLGF